MDESSFHWDMKSKVIKKKSQKRAKFCQDETINNHITGVFPISYNGICPVPLVIMGSLNNVLKILQKFEKDRKALIRNNSCGFMTKEIFFDYCIHFIDFIRNKQNENYFSLNEPILLILDGHISRANVAALVLLRNENIHFLTLPSHLTHILQPYDVGIAQSLRSSFKKILRKIYRSKKMESKNANPIDISTKRILMI